MATSLTKQTIGSITRQYRRATRRLFCLDYDGTLVDFAPTPERALPTAATLTLLDKLASDPANTIVIVSGRDKHTLHAWLGHLPVGFSAEHGQFIRKAGGVWRTTKPVTGAWKPDVRRAMEAAKAALPKSFIEEKDTALCLHFRLSPPALVQAVVGSLRQSCLGKGLVVLAGDKVLEVRDSCTTKALTFQEWSLDMYDFVLIAGDDTTDETMFAVAAPPAITIKVRPGPTAAHYSISSPSRLLTFMAGLLEQPNP